VLADQEPKGKIMDSKELVEPTLANNFELKERGVGTDQVVDFVAGAVEVLPAETVRIISLIGGAASGKSTLRQLLLERLKRAGLSADYISTDDFNRGDRAWRWEQFEHKQGADPIGKYDFELLNEKLRQIKENDDPKRTIAVPTYNQETGLAIDAGEENYTHHIGKVDVLVVEGDFHPVETPSMVVYLHVPDDQRLQNRVNRDVIHRGGDPAKTTDSFNFRHHTQHIPHTLPSIKEADIVLDVGTVGDEWSFNIYGATR